MTTAMAYRMNTTRISLPRSALSVALAATLCLGGAAIVPEAATRLAHAVAGPASPATKAKATAAMAKLPLRFEPNVGQVDGPARFVARGAGYSLFLSGSDAVLSLARPAPKAGAGKTTDAGDAKEATAEAPLADAVRMSLVGADPAPKVAGTEALPGVTNYLIGNDQAKWRNNVPGYAGVRYAGVYPGIDLHYHGAPGGALEYDFELAPGADSAVIAMTFEGGGRPTLDRGGDLVLQTAGGEVRQHKPVVYQDLGGGRRLVEGSFRLAGDTVGFSVGPYDHTRPLVIDPLIAYSTYLGGTSRGFGVATDAAGYVYVSGVAQGSAYPATAGVFQVTNKGRSDRVVTKLDTTRSGAASLVWSTYLGGTRDDDLINSQNAGGIAVDGANPPNVYVTGTTSSDDFPTTAGGFDRGCGSDAAATCNAHDDRWSDGQVTAGSTSYTSAAFFNGSWSDTGGLAIGDTAGQAACSSGIAAGTTIVGHNPTAKTITLSKPACATTLNAPFTVFKTDPVPDAFLTKLNPSGTGLVYSTFLGGMGGARGGPIAKGNGGTVWVAGSTTSADFPTTAGALDTTCGADGNCNPSVDRRTGGASTTGSTTYTIRAGAFTQRDIGKRIDSATLTAGTTVGDVVNDTTITLSQPANGTATNQDYTIVPGRPQPQTFVVKIDTTASGVASLAYGTYLGGSGSNNATGMAVDVAGGVAYLTGTTTEADFPTTPGAFRTSVLGSNDVFVAEINPSAPAPVANQLVYSTYFGGTSGTDNGGGVAVDASGNIYLAGDTQGTDLPTAGAGGSAPVQASLRGGQDAFVAKLNPGAPGPSQVVYATYLGGTKNDDRAFIALDNANPPNAVVVGRTFGGGFPEVNRVQDWAGSVDTFVASLNPTGSGLVYSTLVGGGNVDTAHAVAVDAANNVYVSGETASTDFPTTTGAYQPTGGGYDGAAFLAKIDPTRTAAVITSLSPRGGPTTGATPVVLTGRNFAGATAVSFGSSTLTTGFSVDPTGTQLTVTSPPCPGTCTSVAADTIHVNVTVGTATSVNSTTNLFVYGDGLFSPTAACPSAVCGAGTEMVGSVTLNSGKVLVVSTGSTRAALYDPAGGTWVTVPAPCTSVCAGLGATMTVLRSGKVLLAGGQSQSVINNAGFVFDPATTSWSPTTNTMSNGRTGHTATLLASNKVLIAGGCLLAYAQCEPGNTGGSGAILATAELYDPSTNSFAPTGTLLQGHTDHGAVLLSGTACAGASPPSWCGKVLVAGSGEAFGGPTPNASPAAELYDPVSGLWSAAASMKQGRAFLSATMLGTGKVLVAGGSPSYSGANPPIVSAELYDPGTNTWADTGSTGRPHVFASGAGPTWATLGSGKVVVAGGIIAELYDPTTGTWRSAGAMAPSPSSFALLPSGPVSVCGTACGKVLVVGAGTGSVSAADIYTPQPAVSAISPLTGRPGATVTLTGTGLASVDKVSFGTTSTTAVTHDATSPDTILRVTAPTGTAGTTVNVVASSAGGVSATSTLARFSFIAVLKPIADFNGNGTTDR
ncbi:MAG TPA: SBBP repeat-containing protein, partial [Acidimicrobiales bacterium]|nr:SBBP repeat-containing protein [Acidimicrobiales bacterium]